MADPEGSGWSLTAIVAPACLRRLIRAALCIPGVMLALASQGCASPTQPGRSVASARPLGPATGAQVSYYSQPVVITLASGVATGGATTTTMVEVATDTAFTTIVRTEQATQDANGQLTVVLDDLSSATTYYWRAKTTAGDSSILSGVANFTIGPQLAIQAPIPVQPLSGSFTHKRPILTVANANRNGPSVTPMYEFEIASDPGFSPVLASGTVAEGSNQTSFTPPFDLASGATFYWRVRAINSSPSAVSAYSTAQSFTTVNPEDGLFRYTLTLHLASAANCNQHSGISGTPTPTFYKLPPDVAFDSGLAVTGDHLRYTVQENSSTDVQLDMDRTGNRLSGTLQGFHLRWPGTLHGWTNIDVTVTSGTLNNSGRLTGTSRGRYSDEGFPSYIQCESTDIIFTLVPH